MKIFLKGFFTLFFSVSFVFFSLAQETEIESALEFYKQKQYVLAQSILQNIDSPKALLYNAKCSKELSADDTKELFQKLIDEYPYSNFVSDARLSLADIYFNEKEYTLAIDYYKLVEKENSNHKVFNFAYSYFQIDSLERAKYLFSKLLFIDSEYQSASKYYFAHISYKSENYQSSLRYFKELRNDSKFKNIVPYYISQIYYFLQEYQELISYLEPIVEDVIESRESEVNRLLGESFYRLKDYHNAIKYFEVYYSIAENINQNDHFMIAFSYYQIADYSTAVRYFNQISVSEDLLGQLTSYYMGASYLRLNKNNFALQSFKKASSLDYDSKIQEESFFNYAKLAYELDLPFENALSIFQKFNDRFESKEKEEHINSLMVSLLKGTSNYLQAYNSLTNKGILSLSEKEMLQELAFFLGVKEFNAQNFDKAILYFNESRSYSSNKNILNATEFWLADAYYQLGDFTSAKEICNNMSTISDNILNNLGMYNLGYTFFKLGEYRNSSNIFRKFIKSSNDSMFVNDALLRIADNFYMLKEFALAEQFYEKSIKFNLFDLDYSLYQRSKCLGLINNKVGKVKTLDMIVRNYRNSIYLDNALFDLADYYKNTNTYSKSLMFYDSVLVFSNDLDLKARSYLSKAMIYYNDDDISESINTYKLVVNTFQKGSYFKEALLGLQSIYVGIAKVDEYITYVNTLPQYKISESEQDSLSYNAAFIKFSEQDYQTSKIAFKKYVNQFLDGIFVEDAYFYLALSNNNLGDSIETNQCFQYIVDNNVSQYLERALIHLARSFYSQEDFLSSNNFYTQLEFIASSNNIKREVIIRLMYGYELIDLEKSVEYANEVLQMEKTDDWLISKANIIISRLDFDNGNYNKAKKMFREIVNIDNNSEGAEAMYMLIYLTYLDDSLDLAEKMIFEMSESFSDDYYIAKAFILLSDIYVVRDNVFQAKATLESIIENYNGEELKLIAQKKREKILESEIVVDNKKVEISYIDIFEDEVEYELIQMNNNTVD